MLVQLEQPGYIISHLKTLRFHCITNIIPCTVDQTILFTVYKFHLYLVLSLKTTFC